MGFRNKVMPDAEGAIRLVEDLQAYEDTVRQSTWNTELRYTYELQGYKDGKTKGDPRKAVTVAKSNNNILEEVANPEAIFALLDLTRWPSCSGGADVVIIDDPQMLALIPLIRKVLPEVEIIYRSHIEVRNDLVAIPGSPKEQVSGWIWDYIKEVDLFISHPVSAVVQYGVPLAIIGFMTAGTDWLDGLNKPLDDWDLRIYHHNLHSLCDEREICGHGAINDTHADIVYNEAIALLGQSKYGAIAKDVIVVRVGSSDETLNAMITTTNIVVQLSLREAGVSEEVGTVGNAACWLYPAAEFARGDGLDPNSRWIMDMAREEGGQTCETGDPILPRAAIDLKGKDKCTEL
ncbi:hypothetical protein HOY80DRAFT_1135549 [Tuber brumale]|nr:hypothetical protein HOY80DRAFT_1135549 [Tuber brumale]